MTYYDHATLLALRLGPWTSLHEAACPKPAHEIDAQLAAAREAQKPGAFRKRLSDLCATLSFGAALRRSLR